MSFVLSRPGGLRRSSWLACLCACLVVGPAWAAGPATLDAGTARDAPRSVDGLWERVPESAMPWRDPGVARPRAYDTTRLDLARLQSVLATAPVEDTPWADVRGGVELSLPLPGAAADKQNNIPAWDLKARKAFYPAPTPATFYTGNPTPKDYTGGTLGVLEDFYAFEWGEALFIMFDPFWNTMTNPNSANDAWHWSLGKPQYDWLKTTLQTSSAKYKFVFMHHIVGGSTQAIINGTPSAQYAARGGIEVSDKYEWGRQKRRRQPRLRHPASRLGHADP